jgi:hypothetical protein
VIGREFDLELLAAVVAIDEPRLLDLLEGGVAASLLSESVGRVGRFRFAHALINQTLHDGLGTTRRARIHLQVAEALEELYGEDPAEHLPELSLHWRLAAVSVNTAKASGYAVRAGRRALSNLAPGEAVKLFADAVELSGDTETQLRCEALIGLGDAQRQTGDPAYNETLREASRIASELADPELAARAALANNRGLYSSIGQVDGERLAAIERAIELDATAPDPVRRARLAGLQALELTYTALPRRLELCEEALALARAAGDRRTLAVVLLQSFHAVRCAVTLGFRSALAEELSPLAEELRDPGLRRAAQGREFDIHIERGQIADARAALARMQATAAELGQPYTDWVVGVSAAGMELMRGDLTAGERIAERAFGIGQAAGEPDAVPWYGTQVFFTRVYQGRGEEIIALLEQTVTANPGLPAFRAGLANTLCLLGRPEQADRLLAEAASDRFAAATDDLSALQLYADTTSQVRDRGAAELLYDLIEPFSEQVDWNGLAGYGHTSLYRGLLAGVLMEPERTDQHLSFACEFHEANDMPLWAARSRLGWAEALIDRGDAVRAQEQAVRALELSQQHGYGAFEARAAAALASAQTTAEA